MLLFQTEQTTCPDMRAGKSRTPWALPTTCDWKASAFCLLVFVIVGWRRLAQELGGSGGSAWNVPVLQAEVWMSLGSLLRAAVLGSLQASQEAAPSSMAPRNKHGLWLSSSSLPHLCSSQCWVIPLCEFPFLFSKPLCFCLCLRTWERFFPRFPVTSQVEESTVVWAQPYAQIQSSLYAASISNSVRGKYFWTSGHWVCMHWRGTNR